MPPPSPLGHPEAADDPGAAGERRGQPAARLAWNKKLWTSAGPRPPQRPGQPGDGHGPAASGRRPGKPTPIPAARSGPASAPSPPRATTEGAPAAAVQARRQRDQGPLGPADVEVGDRQRDRAPAEPARAVAGRGRQASGQARKPVTSASVSASSAAAVPAEAHRARGEGGPLPAISPPRLAAGRSLGLPGRLVRCRASRLRTRRAATLPRFRRSSCCDAAFELSMAPRPRQPACSCRSIRSSRGRAAGRRSRVEQADRDRRRPRGEGRGRRWAGDRRRASTGRYSPSDQAVALERGLEVFVAGGRRGNIRGPAGRRGRGRSFFPWSSRRVEGEVISTTRSGPLPASSQVL